MARNIYMCTVLTELSTAIKTFEGIILNEVDEKTMMEIREEAQMMEQLGTLRVFNPLVPKYFVAGNHPNVISFVGAVTTPSALHDKLSLCLVTEYCENGSLFDFMITRHKDVNLVTLIKMARDIAAGILVSETRPYLFSFYPQQK